MSKSLIIYHGNCYDGFTAAWIATRAMNGIDDDADLFAARYGESPPGCAGRDVYMLDFSYPRDVMIAMDEAAHSMMVLDHHKTAQEECKGLDFCTFDMDRSGCRMAWDEFMMGPPPEWVLRIEDRDLWRFRYDNTKFVHAYVASLSMTIENWDGLNQMGLDEIVRGGASIRQYIETYLDKAAQETRLVHYGGWDGPLVAVLNIPYQNASEAADVMLQRHPEAAFSIGYFQRGDGRWQFSLRSRGDYDVSDVAKKHGGGGHSGAAGFELHELPFWMKAA